MATATNTTQTTANHSPRSPSVFSGGDRRAAKTPSSPSSPWNQIVRGESESIVVAVPSSPSSVVLQDQQNNPSDRVSPISLTDDSVAEVQSEGGDNNAGKKPAWNKPNGGGGAAADSGPVMGAVSWPPLSESTKASPKSSSEGSVSVPSTQGTGHATSSLKPQHHNANPNSTPHNALPVRQKSMKRGGGGGGGTGPANGAFTQPLASPGPVENMQPSNSSKPWPAGSESSPRENATHKGGHWESGQRSGFVPQSHNSNDHAQREHQQQQPRNSNRRGNGGSHPRGDGSYHHNYGGRRDQDRGNHDWSHHRSFNGREAQMQPQRVHPRGIMRAPHASSPFIAPPAMRPFVNPMAFHELTPPMIFFPPDSMRAVPFVPPMPPPPMYFPPADWDLRSKIVKQIDYYFCNDNLIKDTYLRQNMDEEGWVPISLIAGFNKVIQLTDNISLILETIQHSSVVEVQGDKVRRRNDWKRWVMPTPAPFSTVSDAPSPLWSSPEMLATRLQSVALEEKVPNPSSSSGQADIHSEAISGKSFSGDMHGQSQAPNGQGTGEVTGAASVTTSSRNSSKRELC
ncbi:La-type HTH domain [Dillenia turbinata]|uniref:La-type HTH domain n=1 Tax=Dillenia turbinata TaxID=194707 RepID=A0AAN8UZ76_9MAGN